MEPRRHSQDNRDHHSPDHGGGTSERGRGGHATPAPAKPAQAGPAWAAKANALADWALKWLVNRTDVWGQYLPTEQRTKGKARTMQGELTRDILIRHFQGARVADLIGLHTTSSANDSRWLAIDIDLHGEPDRTRNLRNRGAAQALYRTAAKLGFSPLLIGSNGQGGYHLFFVFDRPTPTPRVFAFGQWLIRDWQGLGLAEKPELYPKQPRLDEKTKFGNWLRLPGRHHTKSFFSWVWTGQKWVAGEEAIRVILQTKGTSAEAIPAEAAPAQMSPQNRQDSPTVIPSDQLSVIQRRALALLQTKMAIQGQGGDKATWTAALYLMIDFGFTVEQALPVFRAWNATHCRPPWREEDLLRKLQLADQEPGPRGRLLESDPAGLVAPELAKLPAVNAIPYYAEVPDFILSDWATVMPRHQPRKRGRPSLRKSVLYGLIRAAVIRQCSSSVCIPDVLFAQLLWGGDQNRWPRRWRRALKCMYLGKLHPDWKPQSRCTVQCPLYGRADVRHRHLLLCLSSPEDGLGYLHAFHVSHDAETETYTYNFRNFRSHHPDRKQAEQLQKAIDEGRRKGRLFAIYLPAWLFGPVLLEPGACRILQAVTRELTRTRSRRSARPDRGEVVANTACPFLPAGRRFVGFNGNGGLRGRARYHGRGYKLKTWMSRSGHEDARRFLVDLQSLCAPLGLIVGAYRADAREWQPLGRLLELVRTEIGRRWLARCRLKIYGPEDYLAAWRKHFARSLGFAYIPGGEGQEAPATGRDGGTVTTIGSALELDAWMCRQGLCNRELADALGVSAALVSYMRKGSRSWSPRFQERLAAFRLTSEESPREKGLVNQAVDK